MAFDYSGFAAIPGIEDIRENVEAAITWGPWDYNKAFIVPTLIDGAARDAGNTGSTTVLRPGLILGRVAATLKCKEWDFDGTDGTEDIFGILLWDTISQQLATNKDRWFGFALVGGNVKPSSIIVPGQTAAGLDGQALEWYTRGLMSGRYMFDDPYHYGNQSGVMGGWRKVVAKTADYTVTGADNGTLFHHGGASAAVTFTLPAAATEPARGLRYGFYAIADQNLTVAAGVGGDLICLNDIDAASVTFQTAGHIIGSMFEVIGFDADSFLVIPHLADDGVIVTVGA